MNFVLSGPFRMDVLNRTDYGGFWLNDSGRMGFDVGDGMGNDSLLGIERKTTQATWEGSREME